MCSILVLSLVTKRFKRSRRWACHSFKYHLFEPGVAKANACWGLRLQCSVLEVSYLQSVLLKAQWWPDKGTKPRRSSGCEPHCHQCLSPDLNYALGWRVAGGGGVGGKGWKTTVSSKLISLTSLQRHTYSKLLLENKKQSILLGNRIGITLGRYISMWYGWARWWKAMLFPHSQWYTACLLRQFFPLKPPWWVTITTPSIGTHTYNIYRHTYTTHIHAFNMEEITWAWEILRTSVFSILTVHIRWL